MVEVIGNMLIGMASAEAPFAKRAVDHSWRIPVDGTKAATADLRRITHGLRRGRTFFTARRGKTAVMTGTMHTVQTIVMITMRTGDPNMATRKT
jgi:hypothetical protein